MSPGSSPLGLQGKCQVDSCPWCVVTVSLCLSELPVAARKGFFGELSPAIELVVGRPAGKMGDVDIAHLVSVRPEQCGTGLAQPSLPVHLPVCPSGSLPSLCSTSARLKFSRSRRTVANGTACPRRLAVRRSQACRCLVSWRASTTSCPTKPLALWPS